MSKIVALWDAVVADLAAKVPELKEVAKYRDEFDDEDKPHFAIKPPGALVAISVQGPAEARTDGRLKLNCVVSVAVIAEERRKAVDTTAAEIAEKIVVAVHQNRFKVDGKATGHSDPSDLAVINFNTAKTRELGVSVWGVAWGQAVFVGAQQQADIPPLPASIPDATMDQAAGGAKPALPTPTQSTGLP